MPTDYSSEGKLSLFPYDPRFRPIAPPETDIFDAPTVQICVNVKWAGHIEGLLDRLLWRDAWLGEFDTQEWAIAQIRKLLVLIMRRNPCGDDDMPYLLRQNPSNACQLQQSVDGGVSWTLAFDYSLCAPSPLLQFNFEQEITNLFQQWSEATTNTDINPNAPTETFVSSPGETESRINARKMALCYALNLYVAAYCETIKRIIDNATVPANLVALALDVASAVAAIAAAASAGATLPLYLALSAAAVSFGVGAYNDLTDAVLNDPAAREAVACLMYTTLRDLEPTAANFATAVNDSPLPETNAELIRAALALDISNDAGLQNQFNAFVNLLGEQLRPAELGLLPACPCEPAECMAWDAAGDEGWTWTRSTEFEINWRLSDGTTDSKVAGSWSGLAPNINTVEFVIYLPSALFVTASLYINGTLVDTQFEATGGDLYLFGNELDLGNITVTNISLTITNPNNNTQFALVSGEICP